MDRKKYWVTLLFSEDTSCPGKLTMPPMYLYFLSLHCVGGFVLIKYLTPVLNTQTWEIFKTVSEKSMKIKKKKKEGMRGEEQLEGTRLYIKILHNLMYINGISIKKFLEYLKVILYIQVSKHLTELEQQNLAKRPSQKYSSSYFCIIQFG